jgi:hypothetical protein
MLRGRKELIYVRLKKAKGRKEMIYVRPEMATGRKEMIYVHPEMVKGHKEIVYVRTLGLFQVALDEKTAAFASALLLLMVFMLPASGFMPVREE